MLTKSDIVDEEENIIRPCRFYVPPEFVANFTLDPVPDTFNHIRDGEMLSPGAIKLLIYSLWHGLPNGNKWIYHNSEALHIHGAFLPKALDVFGRLPDAPDITEIDVMDMGEVLPDFPKRRKNMWRPQGTGQFASRIFPSAQEAAATLDRSKPIVYMTGAWNCLPLHAGHIKAMFVSLFYGAHLSGVTMDQVQLVVECDTNQVIALQSRLPRGTTESRMSCMATLPFPVTLFPHSPVKRKEDINKVQKEMMAAIAPSIYAIESWDRHAGLKFKIAKELGIKLYDFNRMDILWILIAAMELLDPPYNTFGDSLSYHHDILYSTQENGVGISSTSLYTNTVNKDLLELFSWHLLDVIISISEKVYGERRAMKSLGLT
jgi:hypothetical protein